MDTVVMDMVADMAVVIQDTVAIHHLSTVTVMAAPHTLTHLVMAIAAPHILIHLVMAIIRRNRLL